MRLDAPFLIPGGTYVATTTLTTTPGSREVTTTETLTLPDEQVNGCISPTAAGEGEPPEVFPPLPDFLGGCPASWLILLIVLAALLAILTIVREYERRRRAGRPFDLRLALFLITLVAVAALLLLNGCYHWWWVLILFLEWLAGCALVVREDRRRRSAELPADGEPPPDDRPL